MMADQATATDMVRRKLNVTWEDEGTDARIADVIGTVTPRLNARLGLAASHEFAPGDPDMGLFLDACLYEFSDALDEFLSSFADELACSRLIHVTGGDADASPQG